MVNGLAGKLGRGTWWDLHAHIDPWSYEALLMVKQQIGAPTESAALRFILRRAAKTLPRKLRVKPPPATP